MSGTSGSDDINGSMITEIVEKNKEKACLELFNRLPIKLVGTMTRTFLCKGRKFLVTLKDVTDG